jgi:hypothetical protein
MKLFAELIFDFFQDFVRAAIKNLPLAKNLSAAYA